MQPLSRRTQIIITTVVVFVSALAFLYYIIFPGWVRNQITDLPADGKDPFAISIEKVYATGLPIGLRFKNVTIQKRSREGIMTDSLFVQQITIQDFNPFSFLFKKEYKVGHITLDHLSGRWSLSATDTSKVKTVIPIHSSVKTLTLKNISLVLKKEGSSQKTSVENANMKLKNVVLTKDSLFSSITYEVRDIDLAALHYVTADSFYTFRAHQIRYSAKNSSLQVDSFFSMPNHKDYAFARRQPYQTDRIYGAFKNIKLAQFQLNELMTKGDMRISSIHMDTFLLDIFRDRRRPFLHKKRPLYQDLLALYPGVLSIDSIVADNGKIIFTEHEMNASEPGIIWFSDVTASVKHLYNDTAAISNPHDTLFVAAKALAMDKGKIQFESKGLIGDPQNRFVFTGQMENIPVVAFNPMLIPNVAIEAADGFVNGIYFNFSADYSNAKGDLIFRYKDLRLLKVDKETSEAKGLKNRIITSILNQKLMDHNPLPNDTLRHGAIYFERDPEKMYFSYMLKSIFSGIKESVMN